MRNWLLRISLLAIACAVISPNAQGQGNPCGSPQQVYCYCNGNIVGSYKACTSSNVFAIELSTVFCCGFRYAQCYPFDACVIWTKLNEPVLSKQVAELARSQMVFEAACNGNIVAYSKPPGFPLPSMSQSTPEKFLWERQR